MLEKEPCYPPLTEDDPLLPRPREFKGTKPHKWGLAELFGESEWGYIAELMLRYAIHRDTGWEPVSEDALHSYTRVPKSVLESMPCPYFPRSTENTFVAGYSGPFCFRGKKVLHSFTSEGIRTAHRRVVGLGSLVHRLPRPTCIALDYDFTVARFLGGFNGLHELLSEHAGMPVEVAKDAHDMAEKEGFTPEQLLTCAGKLGFYLDAKERITFHEAFSQWLRNSLHLYSEANVAAAQWAGVPVHIVSFGNREYQGAKIAALCVPHAEVHIVQEPKTAMLHKLHVQYGGPIWFFDDNPDEHNAVRDAALTDEQVICLLVTRRESPHYQKITRYPHRRITSLLDVHWE